MATRINKYLSEAGVCSRREADSLVSGGKVTIDGQAAELGSTVEQGQEVQVSGKIIRPRTEKYYLLFNKPVGVIVTTDRRSRDNILEALERAGWPLAEKRVVPVGRLDVASGGLIMLTSDTDAAEKLLRAEGEHEKEYLVTVDKPLTREAVKAWTEGMMILGRKTLPAKVRQLKDDHFSITLVQGMNRQIRRMCEAFGYEVKVLKRVRIMHLHLDRMKPGEYRELTEQEVRELRREVGVEKPDAAPGKKPKRRTPGRAPRRR